MASDSITKGPRKPRNQSYPRLTIITVVLMLLVSALIIYLDRNQLKQLEGHTDWRFLILALICVAISYLCASASVVVMFRVFGILLDRRYLLRLGLVSVVLENLVAHPAGLWLRLLLLGRRGVSNRQVVAASLLVSYFKNVVFFSLIPFSLAYVVFTYPLVLGGLVAITVTIVISVIVIVVSGIIIFNRRSRELVLRLIGNIWHRFTRRSIEDSLNQFSTAVTEGIANLRQQNKMRLPLLGLILVDVIAAIIALRFCFAALGIPVHLGVLITGFTFGITLTVISFIPGDVGIQEASMGGIFALFDVPFGYGILVAILFRALYYFVPFIFSLGFYWRLLRETKQT